MYVLAEKIFLLNVHIYQRLFRNECSFITDLCTTFPCHIFAMCMFIFHKIEVLTVILRCLTGPTYDLLRTLHKTQIFPFLFFFAILYKNRRLCLLWFFCIYLCVFCHNFCTNYITSRLIKHLKMTV